MSDNVTAIWIIGLICLTVITMRALRYQHEREKEPLPRNKSAPESKTILTTGEFYKAPIAEDRPKHAPGEHRT